MSHAEVQAFFDGMPQGVAFFDGDDRLRYCNAAYAHLHEASRVPLTPGHSFEALLRAQVLHGYYPEAASDANQWLATQVTAHRRADGKPRSVRLKDGRTLLATESPLPDGGILSFHIDISALLTPLTDAAPTVRRALVVDDNTVNRVVLTRLMEEAGFLATAADSGAAAVARAQAANPAFDLVLMDWQMPEMDGIEAAQRIHALSGHTNVPVVMVTAATPAEMKAAHAEGIAGYLFKPVRREHLEACLLEIFGTVRKKSSRSNDTPLPADNAQPAKPLLALTSPDSTILDLSLGLEHVQGDAALFIKLASHFRSNQADAVTRVCAACEAGDFAGARRVAHSLKGIAGTLGATPLSQAASALETALKAEAPSQLTPLIDTFRSQLEATLAIVDQITEQAQNIAKEVDQA